MIEGVRHGVLPGSALPCCFDATTLVGMQALAEWTIYMWPAVLVLLWLFGQFRDRHAVIAALATCALALLAAHGAAGLMVRPSRAVLDPVSDLLDHTMRRSFPSDPGTLLFGLAFSAFGLAPPAFPRLGLASVLIGVAVTGARIILGIDDPIDVLASILVAVAAALLVHSVWGRMATIRLTSISERFYGIAQPANDRLTR